MYYVVYSYCMNVKGFTLIELLIVIAIIGILAGTVVVSLSGETDQARDATTKLAVSSLRSPAISEQFRSNSGNTLCNKLRGKIKGGTNSIDDSWTEEAGTNSDCLASDLGGSVQGDVGKICCASNASRWVVWGRLSEEDKFWCTDHNENLKEVVSSSPVTITTSDYTCN